MPKVKLDAQFALIAKCEPGKAKTDFYDSGSVKGLVLECRAGGGKTYYLRYQDMHGRQRQHRIAGYGDATFDKIKKEAQRLRSEITLGGDPRAVKAAAKAVPMYAELAVQHMIEAKLTQRSYDTTEMYMRRHIVTRWGKVRLTDIDPRAVAQWLADKRKELAPATVEKIRAIFGRSFELGLRWGIPGCERNPTKGIARPPLNNARERFLTADEATRLRTATIASRNPQLQHIVNWLLYTGCRLRECLDARWENVDVEGRRWLIPTSKSGKSRHVPLSTAALEVITALPKFQGCPWVFTNPDTLKPFVSIKHGWQTARDEAGLQGLRCHDLRHAFASFAINSGVDLYSVGKILGHSSIQSTQRYSHLANDTLLAAVEAGAAKQKKAA